MSVYGTSAVKRSRSTKIEIAALEEAIYAVCQEERPLSVRGLLALANGGLIGGAE